MIFENYSNGLGTSRDAWCYNSSKKLLMKNMQSMISFYNNEVDRLNIATIENDRIPTINNFISSDKTRISWTRALKKNMSRHKKYEFDSDCVYQAMYRPFFKQWVYFNREMNEVVFQMPHIFPTQDVRNRTIITTGFGQKKRLFHFNDGPLTGPTYSWR